MSYGLFCAVFYDFEGVLLFFFTLKGVARIIER